MVLWTYLRNKTCWVNQVGSSKVVTQTCCFFIYVHIKIKRKMMTTYLKMLPSLLEHDDTMWWRIDDLWWSSLSAWSFPCLSCSWAFCLTCVLLLSHYFVMPFFSFVDLVILLGPSALLIVSFLQKISRQHIPKGIYNW
jgi:hypothetical protein